jgi:hypothetical protein
MPPNVPAQYARGHFQHCDVKTGTPPTAPVLPIENNREFGTSRRQLLCNLHRTVAVREAAVGPKRTRQLVDVAAAFGSKADIKA